MDKLNILVCGNYEKEEIIANVENLSSSQDLSLIIKDGSKSSHIQNIEYYFSLINDIEYFNTFILNFERKENIFDFFQSFQSEDYGITKECYPFFVICEKILSKIEVKKFITEINKSKEDEYKIQFGNLLFYDDIKGNEFKYNILSIYNYYFQDSKNLKEYDDSKETINILLIGVKNSGKSFLINKLLSEKRALSMENHYTTKLNVYQHRKYPIVFYDIAGFNENEDNEIKNVKSKIDEFNIDYKRIKDKIHAIFYVIDCNNVRILQNKEKKLIEQILEINIPIFIVGQKAKKTNIKSFIRKTKFELNTLSNNYIGKIDIMKNRIFCIDSSKESYISLLESVYEEFLLSKKVNEKIINEYSNVNIEKLINNSFSENFNINLYNEEKQNILEINNYVKQSIFFNNFLETIKKVCENVMKIERKYSNKRYYFKKLDIKALNNEIEEEFKKIFSPQDLEKIDKILKDQQKELSDNGKDIGELKNYFGGSLLGLVITILLAICLSSFCWFTLPVIVGVDGFLINNRDNKTKSIIKKNIENLYKKFESRYISINLTIINNKAEIYNEIIEEFKKYINEFKNNDFIN